MPASINQLPDLDHNRHQIIEDITQAMVAGVNLVDFLQTTVGQITETLSAAQTTLITFDLIQRTITHFISSDVILQQVGSASIEEVMKNLSGWALVEYKPEDFSSLEPINSGENSDSQGGSKSSITAPLIYGERILGILTVKHGGEQPPFTQQDKSFLAVIANLVAIAVENNRLQLVESQQRKQAETLREVARILNYSLDQQRVLELILDQIARVVQYDSASIMLVANESISIVAHRMLRPDEVSLLPTKVDDYPHIKEVLERRRSVIIPDTHHDTRWRHMSASAHIRCWLGVPLIGKNQAIGLLNLDKGKPGFYSHQDAALAEAFANQAAIAIENARLYSAERQRVNQLDALRATVADISAELELSKLLKAIVERAALLLNTTGGDLGLYDDNRQDLLIVVSHNMGKNYAGTRMAVGEGAMGLSIKRREAVIIENYSQWENASPQYNTGSWRAVLAVPIMIGKRIMGSIGMVDSDPQRHFTATDQHLLSLFAQHAAIAVENANLYKAAREAAERRAILHQVSQAIVAASLEPEDIYTAIHQAAAQLMPAEAFAITSYNQAKQFSDAIYLVDRGERYPALQIPTNQGVSGRVINSGESAYIPDTLAAQELGDAIHFGDKEQVRSVLAVPMYLRGKVVGMLSAQSYQPWAYTPEDQYLLEMLAAYAAIALDNASLFAHIQQLAITDAVTEIFNRRHLFTLGQREFLRARRFNRLLSAIMLDIDYFKQVNDSYGHAAGDQILHKLAQLLKSTIREIDIVGRYGGEEFTIVLPETDLPTAQAIAERLREKVNETFQTTDHSSIPITVSIGVATLKEDVPDFTTLVEQADAAMYTAKHGGRNRVEVLED